MQVGIQLNECGGILIYMLPTIVWHVGPRGNCETTMVGAGEGATEEAPNLFTHLLAFCILSMDGLPDSMRTDPTYMISSLKAS